MPREDPKPYIRARSGRLYPRELKQRQRHLTIELAKALGEKLDNGTLQKLFGQNEKRIRYLAFMDAMAERGEEVAELPQEPWRHADGGLVGGGNAGANITDL